MAGSTDCIADAYIRWSVLKPNQIQTVFIWRTKIDLPVKDIVESLGKLLGCLDECHEFSTNFASKLDVIFCINPDKFRSPNRILSLFSTHASDQVHRASEAMVHIKRD